MKVFLLGIFLLVSVTADQQECYQGWHYFGGTCYGYGQQLLPWPDAQEFCSLYHGKLLEIETQEESMFIKSLVKVKKALGSIWIGGTDMFTEGTWAWAATKRPFYPFSDWAKGAPVGGTIKECLVMSKENEFQWLDDDCNNRNYFICEVREWDVLMIGERLKK